MTEEKTEAQWGWERGKLLIICPEPETASVKTHI